MFQGGVKVLITGPWQEASSNYSCLFDQISVPASLIQPGVLRCYCPGSTEETVLNIANKVSALFCFYVINKQTLASVLNKNILGSFFICGISEGALS